LKLPIRFLAGIGGLVSGALTASVPALSFFFAGVVFAGMLTPSIWIWKHRFRQTVFSRSTGIAAFLGICLAAPFLCYLLFAAVAWLSPSSPKPIIVPLVTPGPSLQFVTGLAFAWVGWSSLLAVALRIITGRWDSRFVAQLLLAGIGVLALTFATDYFMHGTDKAFNDVLYLSGQSVSGFLVGVSLERQTPRLSGVLPARASSP
jgi:hypothetical protein